MILCIFSHPISIVWADVNVVFFERFGKVCVRSNCASMNQTQPMKAAENVFGQASNTGAIIGKLLKPVIPNPQDSKMQRALQGCLQGWLLTVPLNDTSPQDVLPFITGFQFNTESDLDAICKIGIRVTRTLTGKISLVVPSFIPVAKIVAPADTKTLQLSITVAGHNFQTKNIIGRYLYPINLDYDDNIFPAAEIEVPFSTGAGNLIIVAAAINYKAIRKGSLIKVNDMRWRPMGIIGAMYN
jgi:hypothetical protein